MRAYNIYILPILILTSCRAKENSIRPEIQSISESVYASGTIRSQFQYQVFSPVNGIVTQLFVSEGDMIKKGDPIMAISHDVQKLNRDNAQLSAQFMDVHANSGKLTEAQMTIDFTKNKFQQDSVLYSRQKHLWENHIGSQLELDQRFLAFQNSKLQYESSKIKYQDLKRTLDYNSNQAQKNLSMVSQVESDYLIRSRIDGLVYNIKLELGEMATVQFPVALVGDAREYVLEMQVDEYDILKIREGQMVFLTLDSYQDEVFEAKVSKINPMMNERTKSFTIEAIFTKAPPRLYPNITFEANILIQKKDKALLIPRDYVSDSGYVTNSDHEHIKIKMGLKNLQKVEVLEGLSEEDVLIKPE